MKKIHFVFLVFLFLSLGLQAQSIKARWNTINKHALLHPRTTMAELEKMIAEAERKGAYIDLLRADVFMASLKADVSPDSLQPQLNRMRVHEQLVRSREPVVAALYQTYLGRAVADSVPYLRMALEHKELLARAKATRYRSVIDLGNVGRYFNNDMLSVVGYAVGNVPALHEYYAAHGNRAAAMITALSMLRNRTNGSPHYARSDAYKASLDSLLRLYGDLEVSAEIALEKYRVMESDKSCSLLARATYINKVLALYPRYERMNILRNVLNNLTNPRFRMEAKTDLFTSADSVSFAVNHRNVSELRIRVNRLNLSAVEMDELDEDNDDDLRILLRKRGREMRQVSKTMHYAVTDKTATRRDTVRLAPLPVGIYLVEVSTFPKTDKSYAVVHVSNVRPIIVALPDSMVRIAVVDALTGQPQSGAKVWMDNEKTLYCDARGELLFRVHDEEYAYVYTDQDKACTSISLEDGLSENEEENEEETFSNVLTDRAAYRPGQIVHAAAVIFSRKGRKVTIAKGQDVTFKLLDPQYKTIQTITRKIDDYGTAAADFQLPRQLLNGQYRVEAGDGSCYIRVEEYKRPTFSIAIPDVNTLYKMGDTLHLPCKAKALMGEGVANAAVECEVSYANYMDMPELNDTVLVLHTDAKGHFMLHLPLPKPASPAIKDYTLKLKMTVTDEAGESHEASKNIPVRFKAAQLYIPFGQLMERDSLKNLGVMVHNAAMKEMKLPVSYWLKGHELQVYKGESGRPLGFELPASLPNGRYTLVATCADDTVEHTFVFFDRQERRPPAHVDMWTVCWGTEFDMQHNEPIELHLGTSQRNVHMIYSVVSADSLLERGAIDLSDGIAVRKFRYRPEYGEGIVVAWAWYHDGRLYQDQVYLHKPKPEEKLNLKWETFRNRLQPGTKEEWRLSVTTPDGKPADARLIAGMYDKSLDFLGRNRWSFSGGWHAPLWDVPISEADGNYIYLSGSGKTKALREPEFRLGYLDLSQGLGKMKVTGKVMDEEENALIGCSVSVEGVANRGAVTDMDGRYTIDVPLGKRLVFRYIGYESKTAVVVSRIMNMVLEPAKDALEEVVVVGYGSAAKHSMTGSVSGVRVRGAASVKFTAPVVKYSRKLYGSRAPQDGGDDEADETSREAALALSARTNLAETAFFYPHLTTDTAGRVGISFTLPESITEWHFMGQAHTRDMKHALIEADAVAKKTLMVQPNLPRFVRSTDRLTIQTRLFNTSQEVMAGTATLFLLDPATERPVFSRQVPFRIAADSTVSVSFSNINMARFATPNASLYICKIVASAGNRSDGEQHYLPVLPDVEQVLRTLPFTLTGKETKHLNIDGLFPKGTTGQKLTVEYVDNPAWMLIEALHAYAHPHDDCAICQAMAYYSQCLGHHILSSSPAIKRTVEAFRNDSAGLQGLQSKLAQNPELHTLLVEEAPWNVTADTETAQKRQLADFFDEPLLRRKMNTAISNLRALQLADGSWSWFKGMGGSAYITKAVTEVLVRLNRMVGTRKETKYMLDNAFDYLGDQEPDMQYLYLCALDGRMPLGKGYKGRQKVLDDAEKNAEHM
ncbi:MAG TPA: alpha-2-macroglobulin family protein, partial [Prevotella sp.]